MMMKRSMWTILIIIILWSSVCVTSKNFVPFGPANHQEAQIKQSTTVVHTRGIQDTPVLAFHSTQGSEGRRKGKGNIGYKESMRGLSRLGSRPPRCEHKCGGCIPCDPIQIPTNKDLIGVQYANYEPEGWKCKCGDSYFNP